MAYLAAETNLRTPKAQIAAKLLGNPPPDECTAEQNMAEEVTILAINKFVQTTPGLELKTLTASVSPEHAQGILAEALTIATSRFYDYREGREEAIALIRAKAT